MGWRYSSAIIRLIKIVSRILRVAKILRGAHHEFLKLNQAQVSQNLRSRWLLPGHDAHQPPDRDARGDGNVLLAFFVHDSGETLGNVHAVS